jgi:hypothetical protein
MYYTGSAFAGGTSLIPANQPTLSDSIWNTIAAGQSIYNAVTGKTSTLPVTGVPVTSSEPDYTEYILIGLLILAAIYALRK